MLLPSTISAGFPTTTVTRIQAPSRPSRSPIQPSRTTSARGSSVSSPIAMLKSMTLRVNAAVRSRRRRRTIPATTGGTATTMPAISAHHWSTPSARRP